MPVKATTLFNPDVAERFLKSKYGNNLNTEKNARNILLKVSLTEQEYNTDVFNFNMEQYSNLLVNFEAKTVRSLGVIRSIINTYCEWAYAEGYSPYNLALTGFMREDLNKYINKIAHSLSYFKNPKEFYIFVNELENEVDQALCVLVYEGVWGDRENGKTYDELRNLQVQDCKINDNKLVIYEDEHRTEIKKVISIRPESMKYINGAINQTEYRKGNGNGKGQKPIEPLADSPYVLRSVSRESTEGERMKGGIISQRFVKLGKWTGRPHINAKNIFWSGMLNMCNELETESGQLEIKDFQNVVRRYGMAILAYQSLQELYSLVYKS